MWLSQSKTVLSLRVSISLKHSKPSQLNPQGGIITKEAPIHVSNVMILDPKTGEPTRVGFKVEDGKKFVLQKSGELLDK